MLLMSFWKNILYNKKKRCNCLCAFADRIPKKRDNYWKKSQEELQRCKDPGDKCEDRKKRRWKERGGDEKMSKSKSSEIVQKGEGDIKLSCSIDSVSPSVC